MTIYMTIYGRNSMRQRQRRFPLSALVVHTAATKHVIAWEGVSHLERVQDWHKCSIKEAIYIRKKT